MVMTFAAEMLLSALYFFGDVPSSIVVPFVPSAVFSKKKYLSPLLIGTVGSETLIVPSKSVVSTLPTCSA